MIFIARSYFAEMAACRSWQPGDVVVLMWAYFDESGYHDKDTGHLKRLSFGGLLASCQAWDGFEADWKAILTPENIECFHMADFEKWKEPFNFKRADGTRDQERHNRILSGLLDVIGRRAPYAFGFTRNVSKPSKALEDTYEGCIIDTVMHLANASAYQFSDKISIIFARHKDFASPRIEKYFGFMNYGDAQLGTVGTDTPANLCQLQAADIIGYEISRMDRNGVPKRYPLQKLSDLGCKFRFSNHIP